ncbi:site-specific integrase [Flaviaesturariibacter aridisoli]|uniref:Site-specific integrase n=1 Tax=Flaviaesturariibacter aridisoli TaxID=2545761 RepID=A0A4R4E1C5_9BACT|nr:site-specific integrase [Flaviaesturariibacter aridisoli]TCZ73274.1 site-specific integrase [Flaviaesturariibacter aridisoli]
MNITFALELSSSKGSNGEQSILVRLTQNRRMKRISTGIKVESRYWDKAKQLVKRGHPLYQEYNAVLSEKLRAVTNVYAELLKKSADVVLEDVVHELENASGSVVSFFDFAHRTKLAEIKGRGKLGTLRRYEAVLSKLRDYVGKDLPIRRINYTFLQQYSNHLRSELKNSEDTVSANLSVIRSILNEAIRHGAYTDRNPFDQLQLKYTDNTKEKLTLDELRRIFTTELPTIPTLLLARDVFLACFLAEGSRAGDIIQMKREHIQNGCLVFRQTKTGMHMAVPITPPLQEIIDRQPSNGPYIFPLLNGEKRVNEIVVNSRLTMVNKYLRELAKYTNICKKLTTHVARHTFTDMALQATGGNIYDVQKSLGHTSVKTTELYSRQLVNYQRKNLTEQVLVMIYDKKK